MPFDSSALEVRRVTNDEWELIHPLHYHGDVETWTVPPGFRTDFASVIRPAVWLVPRFGAFTLAAVLHDYFCRVEVPAGRLSSVDADGIFRRVLREQGVGTLLRYLMWAGVRLSAITQAHRRPGWWSTAPKVLGIALLGAPLVLPPALLILVALGVFNAAERMVSGRDTGITT